MTIDDGLSFDKSVKKPGYQVGMYRMAELHHGEKNTATISRR
jgi:hypothetical protein